MRKMAAAVACCVLVACSATAPARAEEARQPGAPNAQAYLHYSLGRLMEVSGALSDALVQYRRANTLDPSHCEVTIAMARTLYALGRLEEAGVGSLAALEICPDNLQALAIRGEILLAGGDPGAAERLLRDVARDSEAPRELAVLYGHSLLSVGRADDGVAYLRSRAEVDSLDPDIASMLGRALLLTDDAEGAVNEFRRAVRLDPDSRAVRGMLSRLLIALDRPEEGVPMLEWMLSRYDAVEPEYISLAAGYSMMGEPERAQAVLDTAAARFGETAPILRARGAAYFGSGDTDSAMEAYERLLLLDGNSVAALNFIAYTLADEGRDLERSLDYAGRAVELEPDNPLLRDTLGWAYFKLGRLEEARRQLDLAVELGGENPIILEHLGDVLSELGDTERAVAVWTQALEMSPGSASTIERIEAAGSTPPEELRAPSNEESR
jgi:tetratricopeptide (TPR) repeat protein